MAGDKQLRRRRNYFINKRFQTLFMLKFCLLLLLGVIVSTGLLFLFSQNTLTSSFEGSRLQIRSTGSAILPSVILTNLITLALIALSSVGITLFVSHRIAGPLYRLEKDLEEIGKGDLTKKISLRKKDQMKAMADAVNEMVSELRDKLSAIQKDVDEIKIMAGETKEADHLTRALDSLNTKIGSSFKM